MFENVTTRSNALLRAENLLGNESPFEAKIKIRKQSNNEISSLWFNQLLYQAGYKPAAFKLLFVSIFLAILCGYLSSIIVSGFAVPIYSAIGASFPLLWLKSKVQKRAVAFSEDYPTVLLAMASSLKVGHTPLDALQRSTQMLTKNSLVAKEIQDLLAKLHAGLPRQKAVTEFGDSYKLPDLELFRTAFLIVLENGGHFAHTLGRLAEVSRDRSTLIKAAQVTTVTMRMTANFLLAIAPLLLAVIALRSDDFWTVLTENEAANNIATIGILLITTSYLLLRKMSSFKP